jgi:hypothetical protein
MNQSSTETVGDIIKRLATTDNYLRVRITVSDEFVNFVKDNLPIDYEYFAEKEVAYQKVLQSVIFNRLDQ